MKKKFLLLMTIMAAIATSVLMVGCVVDIDTGKKEYGSTLPSTAKAKYAINASMSGQQMYEMGLKNYEVSKYVGIYQYGEVITKLGIGEQVQLLMCNRIKDGDTKLISSVSLTTKGIAGVKVNFAENLMLNSDGTVRARKAKNIKVKDGKYEVTEWGGVNTFESLKSDGQINPEDPNRMNLYIVNPNTIKSSTKPEYDKKTKQYTFTLTLDPEKSTPDYIALQKYILSNQNFNKAELTFTTVTLEVVIWENGLIRSITNTEQYSLDKVMGKGTVDGTSTYYFTYDSKEMPMSGFEF